MQCLIGLRPSPHVRMFVCAFSWSLICQEEEEAEEKSAIALRHS